MTWRTQDYSDDNAWRVGDDRQMGTGPFAPDFIRDALEEVMTLKELSEGLEIPYDSLAKAVREGRVQARQSGSTWLSTIQAVKNAIEAGTLRPRNKN